MLTGEPDAGNLHVRFGGRGGANQYAIPTPYHGPPGPLNLPSIPPCLPGFSFPATFFDCAPPDVSPIPAFLIRLNYLNFLQILLGADMVSISSHIH